jgi:hypothetical protein
MIDRKLLLSDLQKRVKLLEDDLRARCDAVAEINDALKKEYDAARAKKRTALTYNVWRDEELTQVAVAWVLAGVFARFLEDNELIESPVIAGPEAGRMQRARDEQALFFRGKPTASERDYFEKIFADLGGLPGMGDFFDRKHNPLWRVGPSADAARDLIEFWRRTDPDSGAIHHDFTDPDWNTRFLGDLYQDLSEAAKKKFALLQTPDFVEAFILDRTLTPAINTFGYQTVRMIDPTCGSGHFLLGSFARLFKLWRDDDPGGNSRALAQKALDGVYGVDLNPFAVAIARFRLLLAALSVCEVKRLKDAPDFRINLAVGDSLLHGARFDSEGKPYTVGRQELFGGDEEVFKDELAHFFEREDREELHRILGQQYHAVVGNPPYITVKDKALNQLYRDRYDSCSGKYALSVPFMERFFDLALSGSGDGCERAGFTGQITSNSFMKREFAKKLIEKHIPRWDLTHVLDTSGAYIPGHGTPTVILFGRNKKPVGSPVRTVMGIAGEPEEPQDPGRGVVWSAILKQIDDPGSESEFVQVVDKERTDFNRHPWSIGGGGAAVVSEIIEKESFSTLGLLTNVSGVMVIPGDDDVLIGVSRAEWRRRGVNDEHLRPFLEGELIRDFQAFDKYCCHFPYTSEGIFEPDPTADHHLWAFRSLLRRGICFGRTREQRGMDWREWAMVVKDKFPLKQSFIFPGIATHNHFILEPGSSLTKQSLPLFRLDESFSENERLKVYGYVSSSVFCFLMKQACYPKERATGDISKVRCRPETNRYDFNSTAVMRLSIPDFKSPGWDYIARLAKGLQLFGQACEQNSPEKVVKNTMSGKNSAADISLAFEQADKQYLGARAHAVLVQEELDWAVYSEFNFHLEVPLLGLGDLDVEIGISPDQRPFKSGLESGLNNFSVRLENAFRTRAGILEVSNTIRFLETDLFKRPWLGRRGVYGRSNLTFLQRIRIELKSWLLARLEGYFFEGARVCDLNEIRDSKSEIGDPFDPVAQGFSAASEPQLASTNQLAAVVEADARFLEAAEVYLGAPGFAVPKLIRELVAAESVPFLPGMRYKETGLRKREDWEGVWELQRAEDAVEAEVRDENASLKEDQLKPLIRAAQQQRVGDIPVPPKYAAKDFKKTDWWKLRGKLDVPKERWVIYPGAEREEDGSPPIAWAGWDHLQQARALAAYYLDASQNRGWSAEKLRPLLAGLVDLLPWLKQWHNDYDPELAMGMGDYFSGFVEEEARKQETTVEALDELRFS